MMTTAQEIPTGLIPASEDYHINPRLCLCAALRDDYDEIVIITRSADGSIDLWTSDNIEKSKKLIDDGVGHWLTDDE